MANGNTQYVPTLLLTSHNHINGWTDTVLIYARKTVYAYLLKIDKWEYMHIIITLYNINYTFYRTLNNNVMDFIDNGKNV